MRPIRKPVQILLYQDVLCAWCYLAEARLQPLRDEFRELASWKIRPFPLRLDEAPPSPREIRQWSEQIRRARQEPEGGRLRDDLWTQGDPPRSSLVALAALEAARLQGPHARAVLARTMQRAALEQGVNVSRSDVVFELASHVGLNMNRFAAAFKSSHTQRLILEEHRVVSQHGLRRVPTLVIANRWMICGLRKTQEYRDLLLSCLSKAGVSGVGTPEFMVH